MHGKARSSANALRHGGYATRSDAITASILREDPDEVAGLIDAVVTELDPQTPLEDAAANTVATRVLNRARIDRLTAPLIEAAETELDDTVEGTAPNEVRVGRDILRALDALANPADRDGDYWLNFDWARLYWDVPYMADAGHYFQIEHSWNDGELCWPRTIEECFERFEALLIDTHGSCEQARETAQNQVNLYSYRADSEIREDRAAQARQILDEFDRTTQLADRVDRGVDRALNSYTQIRRTNNTNGDDPRNEPNPNL